MQPTTIVSENKETFALKSNDRQPWRLIGKSRATNSTASERVKFSKSRLKDAKTKIDMIEDIEHHSMLDANTKDMDDKRVLVLLLMTIFFTIIKRTIPDVITKNNQFEYTIEWKLRTKSVF